MHFLTVKKIRLAENNKIRRSSGRDLVMDKFRLSLAYRDLEEIHPSTISKFASYIKELDLSNNQFSDLESIRQFTKLETLVLDSNEITSHTKFPPLPSLRTLWVNRNKITNLAAFISQLVASVPNLRYLSMLNNTACPNYLNGGSLKQYRDYRLYVISRLRNLDTLDDKPVTDEEKSEAVRLYGGLDVTKAEEIYKKKSQEKEEPSTAPTSAATLASSGSATVLSPSSSKQPSSTGALSASSGTTSTRKKTEPEPKAKVPEKEKGKGKEKQRDGRRRKSSSSASLQRGSGSRSSLKTSSLNKSSTSTSTSTAQKGGAATTAKSKTKLATSSSSTTASTSQKPTKTTATATVTATATGLTDEGLLLPDVSTLSLEDDDHTLATENGSSSSSSAFPELPPVVGAGTGVLVLPPLGSAARTKGKKQSKPAVPESSSDSDWSDDTEDEEYAKQGAFDLNLPDGPDWLEGRQ
jgi:microcompartment protein CcmK/EutM